MWEKKNEKREREREREVLLFFVVVFYLFFMACVVLKRVCFVASRCGARLVTLHNGFQPQTAVHYRL